jgi:hypothetical protein
MVNYIFESLLTFHRERATNCRVIALETAQNFKAITESWNIRTDMWLKHCTIDPIRC